MDASSKRAGIKKYLEHQIVGPSGSEQDILNIEPWRHYIAGVLFPLKDAELEDSQYSSIDDATGSGDNTDSSRAEEVSTLSRKLFPSSMGIEIRLKMLQAIKIDISYATYAKSESGWKRGHKNIVIEHIAKNKTEIFDSRLIDAPGYVRIIAREIDGNAHIKVYIVNDGKGLERDNKNVSKCLYQPKIVIKPANGAGLIAFSNIRTKTDNLEDQLLFIRYRNQKIYAAAYGCAALWDVDSSNRCKKAYTTYIPHYELAPLTFDINNTTDVLSLHNMSHGIKNNYSKVIADLENFTSDYEKWICSLLDNNDDLDPNEDAVKIAIGDCQEAAMRMRKGIHLIKTDNKVREAFALANLAMLMQAAHQRKEVVPEQEVDPWGDYTGIRSGYSWRPFQLAFLLMSIEPAAQPDSTFRDIVDLIWFPTGGGKTEAYLGLMAFTIILERLRSPATQFGTTVISRYTLRLLTAQQFERTAALVCALELMRKCWPERLGNNRISLGLWLGAGMTPNRIGDADKKLQQLLMEEDPQRNNPFMLFRCPCCSTNLLPEIKSRDKGKYGFDIDGKILKIYCTRSACPMSGGIPLAIVDEQIYEELPTIIIGTIDKFARLAWHEKAGWLLTGRSGQYTTPSLIIQDELHLICGQLGSLAGVYETAIAELCSANGMKPHIVASTATARRANEQCLALYGRSVKQFPPQGLDESDSYFARKDTGKPGRLYLGIMAPHVTANTASVRVHAALLQAPLQISGNGGSNDDYWTMVSYFNSRKELGSATTMAADDIPDRIKVIQANRNKQRKLSTDDFVDLYSEKKGTELRSIFERLRLNCETPGSVSLLLTTNIISVGVDVDRLGMMLVNGQPKTTAEYIQATSRVGRSDKMPGLVVSLYSAVKPRDRSHFESFHPYHAMLYTFVEPSSVTPFSKPSRMRALHAVMVILARHYPGGLPSNPDANKIADHEDIMKKIESSICARVKVSSFQEYEDTKREIDYLFRQWINWAEMPLHYDSTSARQITSLLHRIINAPLGTKGWQTMDSMRSVDYETRLIVCGEHK